MVLDRLHSNSDNTGDESNEAERSGDLTSSRILLNWGLGWLDGSGGVLWLRDAGLLLSPLIGGQLGGGWDLGGAGDGGDVGYGSGASADSGWLSGGGGISGNSSSLGGGISSSLGGAGGGGGG